MLWFCVFRVLGAVILRCLQFEPLGIPPFAWRERSVIFKRKIPQSCWLLFMKPNRANLWLKELQNALFQCACSFNLTRGPIFFFLKKKSSALFFPALLMGYSVSVRELGSKSSISLLLFVTLTYDFIDVWWLVCGSCHLLMLCNTAIGCPLLQLRVLPPAVVWPTSKSTWTLSCPQTVKKTAVLSSHSWALDFPCDGLAFLKCFFQRSLCYIKFERR